jgi:hypothetical protein
MEEQRISSALPLIIEQFKWVKDKENVLNEMPGKNRIII